MACNEFFYSPDGRLGIGVNQPQSGLDYPFVAPSADIRYLIADCRVVYSEQDTVLGVSQVQNVTHPLRIKWLYGVGCEDVPQPGNAPTPIHAADVLIVDATNAVVFDSTASNVQFNTRCWGRLGNTCPDDYAYRIYEWIGPNAACHIIAYKTWPTQTSGEDNYAPKNYPTHLLPAHAVLDERAVHKMPNRVTSFILPLTASPTNTSGSSSSGRPQIIRRIAANTANFVAGFNMALDATANSTTGLRQTSKITINAVAGAGRGRYEDCVDTPTVTITSLNGLSGPDVLLSANDCLWVRTPGVVQNNKVSQIVSARQQVGSDCPACCTCQDYVDVAKYMNATRDRYKAVGVLANGTLAAYAENIDRWLAQQDCRSTRPLKVCMTVQRCPFIDVVAQYCNVCANQECARNVTLNLNFEAPGIAEPVCGYSKISNNKVSEIPFKLGGSWPNFVAVLGDVDAGNSANVSFRLEFKEATPKNVKLTVTGATLLGAIRAGCNNLAPPAQESVSKALACDKNGNTVLWCE